ncbi:hypothetical protein VNO80_24907 [Phaseolus coccineus]|uniref:Uncharacterized protein n=1 Tax=Phaseolus coccineus TaxID=3886 RepID=A0AAN9LUA7_PHACN
MEVVHSMFYKIKLGELAQTAGFRFWCMLCPCFACVTQAQRFPSFVVKHFNFCFMVCSVVELPARHDVLQPVGSNYRTQIFNAVDQNSDTWKFMDGQNPQTRAQQLTTKLETVIFWVGGLWGI